MVDDDINPKYIVEHLKLHALKPGDRPDGECHYRTWHAGDWHSSWCTRKSRVTLHAVPLCTQHNDKVLREARRTQEWRKGK